MLETTAFTLFSFSVFLVAFLVRSLLSSKNAKKRLQKIKTTDEPLTDASLLPLLLRTVIFGKSRLANFLRYAGEINHMVQFKFWNSRIAVINSFELGKELYRNSNYWSRPQTDGCQFFTTGQYGLLAIFTEWKENRTFCLKHLRKLGFGTKTLEHVQEEAQALIDLWLSKKGEPFSPNKSFVIPMANSTMSLLTGEKPTAQVAQLFLRFFQNVEDSFSFLSSLAMASGMKIKTITKIHRWIPIFRSIKALQESVSLMQEHFQQLISDRRKILGENVEPRNLLDAYLMEVQKSNVPESVFSSGKEDAHLNAILMAFLMGGGEATGASLAWTMLHLVRHPEMQERIQTEIDLVVGKDRVPSLNDRPNCPYTLAFISEALRFNPVVPIGLPHATAETANVGTKLVRKDTTVGLNIYNIHHDPLIWGDPENFRPERFLSKTGNSFVNNEALCPFSLGLRTCAGEYFAKDSMFLFVSAICQRLELKCESIPPVKSTSSFLVDSPQTFYMVAHDRCK